MSELVPRVSDLAVMARDAGIAMTVDAEEADRLELSLDVFETGGSHIIFAGTTAGLGVSIDMGGSFSNFDNTVGICFTPYAIVKYDKDSGEPFRNSEGFMEKVKTGEAGLLLSEISPTTPFEGYTDDSKNEKCLGAT